jgi:hypothetical protein
MTAVQLAQEHLHLHLTLAGVQASTCPEQFAAVLDALKVDSFR